eukprot:3606082-Pyramimonas_sp.AAC.2
MGKDNIRKCTIVDWRCSFGQIRPRSGKPVGRDQLTFESLCGPMELWLIAANSLIPADHPSGPCRVAAEGMGRGGGQGVYRDVGFRNAMGSTTPVRFH